MPLPALKLIGAHRWRRFLLIFASSAAALLLTVAVVPGISVSDFGSVLLATLIVAAVSAVLRPIMATVGLVIGWIGIVLVGLVAQSLILYCALSITPGIELTGFWPAFWASWVYALLIGAAMWLIGAGDDQIFLADVLSSTPASATDSGQAQVPGVVILQLDGVAAPLLTWGVQAGNLPTLGRWLRSGSHRLTGWRAQLPATTPASQAGILHGGSDHVPAFRWYERQSGRVVVTNHPQDAAYVEGRMSDGCGLLADGGVSIGNMFSGDAPLAMLTMSSSPTRRPSRRFAAAYIRPLGFARTLVLSIGEMLKEVRQGYAQQAHDVQPRINRRSSYIALRALTNVVLRDINVRLLAEQMMAGTPVMYCDLTDYDEVAHHAGPARPESLASLTGVDRAIGVLERVAAVAPRHYEFVILSDHGQSQGATFRQRYDESLEDVVRRLMTQGRAAASAYAATGNVEEWGQTGMLLRSVGIGSGPVAKASRSVMKRHETKHAAEQDLERADVMVMASGNLGFVYFPRFADRLTLEDIDEEFPGLLQGLVDHDGVGFLVVHSRERGPVVLARGGLRVLSDDRVEGADPLARYGDAALAEVRRHASLEHVGDIVVNSRYDPETEEVAAFEELVGCHGGLGGAQSEAFLLSPSAWSDPGRLVGANAVHRQLVSWLEDVGQRGDLPRVPRQGVAAQSAASGTSAPAAPSTSVS